MKEKPNNRFKIKKSFLPKPLGGATKQNFYKFQSFQKFDNFLLLSNNSYLSYPSNSKSELSFKNDSEKILQLFKKNVASYLILKRHFDGKRNFSKILHDFKLRNQVKALNNSEASSASLRKNDSPHYDIKNPLKNYTKELDESKMHPILTNEPSLYIKIDCQLKCEQTEIPSFPFKLNLNSLQKKFINKHAAFLNNEKIASELLISRLVDQFNIVLSQIQERKYGLNLPKYLKPMMEDFNDFYREKRKEDDEVEEELKKNENESSNAMMLKIDIEDIFIDQILNNMESSLVEEKQEEKEEQMSKKEEEDNEEEEEEEEEENDEEESKKHQKSHKILKKMEKYLIKKSPPTQNQQNVHNASAGNQQIERNNMHAQHEQINGDLQNNIVQHEEESRNEGKQEELQNSMQEVVNNSLEENNKNDKNLVDELIPPPQRDGSRMELINKLLESDDLYNEDLSVLKKGLVYPQPPADIKFTNEIEKNIFNKIFHWLYEIEIQVEKDKRDIEYYEKEYQLKFKDHYQKYQEMDENDSIFDGESLEDVDEEESDMSYEDENNEKENEKEKNY